MLETTVCREMLSNGSFVYRVDITDGGERIAEFDAFDKKSAERFAKTFMDAIARDIVIEYRRAVQYTY